MFEKMNVSDGHGANKHGLLTRLLDAVKQCQIRFGGKTELATENDSRVCCLCAAWEAVFQHGLLHNNKALSTFKQMTELTGLAKISSGINILGDLKNLETEPTFWLCVRELISPHELQRYSLLREITSDAGRGRSWLRSMLNEHSLERFLHMILDRPELLKHYYEDGAFLRDQEKASMLPNMAAGLGSILFAIVIDKDSLNTIKPASGLDILLSTSAPAKAPEHHRFPDEPRPVLAMEGCQQDEKRKLKDKKKRKKPVKIVSFDDTDVSSYSGSPSSALTSPHSITSPVDLSAITTATATPTAIATVTAVLRTPLSVVPDSSWSDQHHNSQQPSTPHNMGDAQSATRREREQQELADKTDYELNSDAPYSEPSGQPDATCVYLQPDQLETEDVQQYNVTSSTAMQVDVNSALNQDKESDKHRSFLSGGSVPETENTETSSISRQSVSARHSAIDYSVVHANATGSMYENSSPGMLEGVGSRLRHSDSITSSTSLTSIGSANSQTSWPGEGDSPSVEGMTPVSPDGDPVDMLIFTAREPAPMLTHSQSVDYGEVPMYNEWTQNARTALDVAQMGLKHSALLRTQGDGSHAPDTLSVTHDAMTSEELKQAVIAMMARKDEVENENRMLRQNVLQEQETSSALRSEIDDCRQSSHVRQERDENVQKTLSRENDLLKHQLKKYVNAVQLLRRQGAQPHDFPGLHMESMVQPAIPTPPTAIDYSFEASEYEQKLIQVAEMHGELMEFNEVLQKHLLSREATVRQLTTELVSLRGPLPERPADDSISITSESNAGALISVWIPSAFLQGRSSDAYHVYQVYVRIRDEEWNVYRRYTQFSNMHSALKKSYPVISSLDFPKKKALGSKDHRFVEERRKKLESYIRKVINLFTRNGSPLSTEASKEKLIKTLEFFGETPAVTPPNNKSKGKKGKSSPGGNGGSAQGNTAHYTGL